MALTIYADSHLDHNLSQAHLEWITTHFADRVGFFIETLELPEHLGEVDCGLYGPSLGDEPVDEKEVTYLVRQGRRWTSRVVDRPVRKTRTLTIVAGPYQDSSCVLYTSYGGPNAPREPGDFSLGTLEEIQASREFWKIHALAKV